MGELEELLELQGHDTVIDQLEHRLATLPERAAVEKAEAELATNAGAVAAVEADRHVQVREQTRLEDSVVMVEDKREKEEAKLYDGSVTAVKELQALQEEIAALKRRQAVLEDELIEILEAIEPLDAELGRLATERTALEEQRADAAAQLNLAEGDTRTELSVENERRAAAAEMIPDELMAEYEKLRARMRGIAVARLSGNSCMGCHLVLSAVEVDRIRKEPPGAVIHCEECGRILVP